MTSPLFSSAVSCSSAPQDGSIDATLLRDVDHGGDPNQSAAIAAKIADFVAGARSNLHIAIYDFRLGQRLGSSLVNNLIAQAKAGLEVKVAYDHTTPNQDHLQPNRAAEIVTLHGGDLKGANSLTSQGISSAQWPLLQLPGAFAGTQVQTRPIAGLHLMHNKYILRDVGTPQAALLTGSTNFTDDAWTHQENNLVVIASPALASYYETDFQELWTSGNIASTGVNDTGTVCVGNSEVAVNFSPGDGYSIDAHLAGLVSSARTRIKVCSMLLSSHKILGALSDALTAGQIEPANFGGIYDATQMETVLGFWRQKNNPAVQAFQSVAAHLAAKHSVPYTPDGLHNFMHNKVMVCDDFVATGSFNFSSSATQNSENSLIIRNQALADLYANYIDALVKQYGAGEFNH